MSEVRKYDQCRFAKKIFKSLTPCLPLVSGLIFSIVSNNETRQAGREGKVSYQNNINLKMINFACA
jgi:hypothetical protein